MLTDPPISKDLIEYLEKVYAPALFKCQPDASPHFIAALAHREMGIQSVIQHLKAVYEEQQNEDPHSVHEDP